MKTRRFCAFALILILAALLPFGVFAEGEDGSVSPEPPALSAPPEPPAASVSSEPPQQHGFLMSYGYKPLVAPDGTRASNYVKGTAPAASRVGRGDSYKVAENGYSFRDYVFTGWSCGGELYRPGETIYNVQSDMYFVAQWARPKRPEMAVFGVIKYRVDGKITETVSAGVGGVTTLKSGTWRDGEGRVFKGGSAFLLSATSAEFEPAGAIADAVTVSYAGVASGAQCPFSMARGGVFTVDGCFAEREGFAFTGWESGGRLCLEGDSCEAAGDMVFTAVWRELDTPEPDFCKVSAGAGEGGRVSPVGQSSVERGQSFTFTAIPDKGYALASVVCGGRELGTNGSYTVTVNADLEISVQFVKTETPPESEPAEESPEAGSPEPAAAETHDTPAGSASPRRKAGATAAAAIFCALGAALALWFSVRSGGFGSKGGRHAKNSSKSRRAR